MHKEYKVAFLPRFVKQVFINTAGLSQPGGSVVKFCHSDVIYFVHALFDRTSAMRARVLTQKSEEATVSSASLLAVPMLPTVSTVASPYWIAPIRRLRS